MSSLVFERAQTVHGKPSTISNGINIIFGDREKIGDMLGGRHASEGIRAVIWTLLRLRIAQIGPESKIYRRNTVDIRNRACCFWRPLEAPRTPQDSVLILYDCSVLQLSPNSA